MLYLLRKDLQTYFSDIRQVLFTFALPIVLISLFAMMFGAGSSANDMNPLPLLIQDLDQTPTSEATIEKLQNIAWLQLKADEDPETKIKSGNYFAALVIRAGFESAPADQRADHIEVLFDRAQEMEMGILFSILNENKDSIIDPVNTAKSAQKPEVNFRLRSVVGEVDNKNLGLIHAVCGTSILMLMFSVSGLGSSILQEKELGTLDRLLYSPLSPTQILAGKMIFTFVVGLMQLTVMLTYSWLVFGLDIFSHPLALLMAILATTFGISSFGIFLASISKSRQQAQSLGTLVVLTMSALGGSIVPLFIMPPFMKKLAMISINYWGLESFYDVFWRDFSISEMIPGVTMMLAIGLVLSSLSVFLFKRNALKMHNA